MFDNAPFPTAEDLPVARPKSQQEIIRTNFNNWMSLCNQFIKAQPLTPEQENDLWEHEFDSRNRETSIH